MGKRHARAILPHVYLDLPNNHHVPICDMQRGREWFLSLQQDKTDKAPVIDVMKAGYMKAVGVCKYA